MKDIHLLVVAIICDCPKWDVERTWGADYFGCISPNWCVARCSRCGVFGRGGGESHGGGGRWVHSGGCFGDAGER